MKKEFLLGVILAGAIGYGAAKGIDLFLNSKSEPVKKARGTLKQKTGILVDRLDEILQYLKNKKVVGMKEIAEIFPRVSSRTLRRDMDKLQKQGKIRQIGLTRDAKYVLNI